MEFIVLVLLAAFAIGLGFLALLKQKTYLDKETGAVTDIEVPIAGKLKTNYPALVFVFIGFAFGYLAYKYQDDAVKEKDNWIATKPFTIDGQLKTTEKAPDWSTTEITVIPSSLLRQQVDPSGHYRIDLQIPKWQSFDKWIEAINFQAGPLSGRISPGAANDTAKYNKKGDAYWDADVAINAVK